MARADFTGYTKRSRTVAMVVTGAPACASRQSAICSPPRHEPPTQPRATAQPRAPKPRGTHMTSDKSPPASLTGLARTAVTAMVSASVIFGGPHAQGRTQKPALYGRHWMAVTGKPIAATAGAKIFEQGGNAVDAACAMIAATSTAWTTLSWGGETQALIYNPHTAKVIAINGLGIAPTGATPEYFHKLGMKYPPEYGPLAAVTPGTPGGLMTMLAEFGTMSLGAVLELGGLFTLEDLANWNMKIEEPVHVNYKGIEVYKLTTWVQGPVMLQTLNILENLDLKSMGYDSARYIHALYQAMSLAYADRDFYYGDPAQSPAPPIRGLLSKEYARERAKLIRWDRNDPDARPGDPYPFQDEKNPYLAYLEK